MTDEPAPGVRPQPPTPRPAESPQVTHPLAAPSDVRQGPSPAVQAPAPTPGPVDTPTREDTNETTPAAPPAPGSAPGEALSTLLHGYRVHARAPRQVVAALTERPRTLRELIQETGLPRRSVEEILACLGDDLHPATDGRQVLRAGAVDRYRTIINYADLRSSGPLDPLGAELHRRGALITRLHELIAAAPRPRAELDHVPATAATVVRRAVWLSMHYDLRESRLLCVGDHDLTSLAVALLAADDAQHRTGPCVTVVDIDEDLLEYLDRCAHTLGVPLRSRYADLRFGLPPSLVGDADLVFTDPPYTPAGVSLFASRGAQALADRTHGRVLIAYGYSPRTPALGAKVQRALLDQGFVFEAIWPAFHTYDGAEAVGAQAAMYACQPTATTWKRLERPADREPTPATIYTRGRQSAEGRPAALSAPALDAARRFLADAAPARGVFIGDQPAGDAAHVRLATVLDRPLPSAVIGGGDSAGRPAVVADLTDDPGPWLKRLLLAVNADQLAVLIPAGHPDLTTPRPFDLLAAKWRPLPGGNVTVPGEPDTRMITFTAVDPAALTPADRLARWLLDRPHGRLANVWRDGLIRLTRDRTGSGSGSGSGSGGLDGGGGQASAPLSQRQALAAVRSAVDDPDLLTARLLDLPWHTVGRILATATAAAGSDPRS